MPKPKSELWLLVVLATVNFTHVVDFMIMMPLASDFQENFGIDSSQWGMVISSYTIGAGLSGFLSLFYLDRFERRSLLLILYAGFIAGTLLTTLSWGLESILVTRFVTGIFGGIIMASIFSIIGDVIPPERRGRAIGIVAGGFSAAAALGVPIALGLTIRFGWKSPFIAVGLFSMLVFILVIKIVPSVRSHLSAGKPNPLLGLKLFANDKNQWLAMSFLILAILGQFTIIPFIAPYMEYNVGFSKEQLTLMYFFGGLATVVSSPIIGRLSDRFNRLRISVVLTLVAMIPVLLLTQMGEVHIVYAYAVTTALFIFLSGRMIPAGAIVLSAANPKARGSFMSLRSSSINLASSLAALIAGAILYQQSDLSYVNYDLVGYISCAICILSLVVLALIKERY